MPNANPYAILDKNGQLNHALDASYFDSFNIQDIGLAGFKHMLKTRWLDEKIIALQRTGRMGTYASSWGQEAIGTAIGLCLKQSDVFVPYYRDLAAQLLRGVQMREIMAYWGGDERGNQFVDQALDFPDCVPIATQITHAAGIAAAFKIRQENRAVLVTCGDGATSRGDFYEAMNLAATWHLPLVCVVNNNHWAISTPVYKQTTTSIYQKAKGMGLYSEWVDGNDLLALFFKIQQALDRAKKGKGATLIEADTYRLCDHTTADDAKRYRDETQWQEAKELEPCIRLEKYLQSNQLWNSSLNETYKKTVVEEIQNQVQAYLQLEPAKPSDAFDYLYEKLPKELESQKKCYIDKHQRHRGNS